MKRILVNKINYWLKNEMLDEIKCIGSVDKMLYHILQILAPMKSMIECWLTKGNIC